MSHDNRFPKTNYLKTNLLKQIKKISLPSLRMILSLFTMQSYKKRLFEPNNFAIFCIFMTKKNKKIGIIR